MVWRLLPAAPAAAAAEKMLGRQWMCLSPCMCQRARSTHASDSPVAAIPLLRVRFEGTHTGPLATEAAAAPRHHLLNQGEERRERVGELEEKRRCWRDPPRYRYVVLRLEHPPPRLVPVAPAGPTLTVPLPLRQLPPGHLRRIRWRLEIHAERPTRRFVPSPTHAGRPLLQRLVARACSLIPVVHRSIRASVLGGNQHSKEAEVDYS